MTLMRLQTRLRRATGIFSLLLLLALAGGPTPALAKIGYTDSQRDTLVELVKQLEERHYSKMEYDDQLSSLHLDTYIESLDPGRMFFTQEDLEDFEKYRYELDDQAEQGDLEAGYAIFNRFQKRLEDRLQQVIDTLPETVAAMDFDREESYVTDEENREWAADTAELDELWRKHLKNQVLRLRLADKADDEIVPTLRKRFENQLKQVRQYNTQDVFQIYANALTELYDPHTNYFSPRRSENFNINMSLSLEGIGAVLQREDDYTKVVRLVAAGPADKQGELQPSDRIVAVGQGKEGTMEDVIGWRLDEVVDLIRGPKGTTVRLEVIPAKAHTTDARKVITIVRNKVKLEEQSAHKQIIDIEGEGPSRGMKIGVIEIPAFYIDFEAMRRGEDDYKSTTRDVKKLLDELVDSGVDGIVIDLRNNGGGSLQEANQLTGLFIEYGPTVQIRHSSRRVWRDGKRKSGPYYQGPLAVLVNRLSASASEIFAGAIQDYQRGLVLGDRSFGKGTVQTLIPLTEGQLKITESKFYRISGDSTQHRGVVPDVQFPSMFDPQIIGESSLDYALGWDQINPVRHRRYNDFSEILPQLQRSFEQRSENDPDFVFFEDQIALSREARAVKEVPLNESERRAMREAQESEVLAIENKRREAKGEEPLAALDDDTANEDLSAEDDEVATDNEDVGASLAEETPEATEEDTPDVLLREAARVLADATVLQQQEYAVQYHGEDDGAAAKN